MFSVSLASTWKQVNSKSEDIGFVACILTHLSKRRRGVWKARLQRAAARIHRISRVNFPRVRHELQTMLCRAVAREERLSTAAKVTESRWL
jgi:hypothetical protein